MSFYNLAFYNLVFDKNVVCTWHPVSRFLLRKQIGGKKAFFSYRWGLSFTGVSRCVDSIKFLDDVKRVARFF
jgi:hypothetical protein